MIDQAFLCKQLSDYGLSSADELSQRLDEYARMLVEWNEKINLTAITKPEEIVIKHFLDSLLLLKVWDGPQNANIIDVGTGAGFPSVPVCLYRPDLRLTLLDSLRKRVIFLKELTDKLGLSANCLHGRAEEMGVQATYREQYDLACARAVAHLRELAEYCLPFVKVGGAFAALKGYEIEEEWSQAAYAVDQLGGELEKIEKFTLPDGSGRAIVLIRKVRQTPAKFPRPCAKIKKFPLEKRG